MLPLAALAGLAVLGVWLFRAALGLTYITDDMALLFEVARLRAGDIDWLTYVSGAHNEHRIPILRQLFLVTAVGNYDALPLRLVVLGVHVICGWLVVRITRRLWSTGPAVAAGVIAVSAVAFSSTPVWVPSTAIFSLSLMFVLIACELMLGAGRYRLELATIAAVFACLSLNAAVLCLPVLILAFWNRVGVTARRRAIWAGSWMTIGVVILLWSSVTFGVVTPMGARRPVDAIGNAGFLIVTAPYRWLSAWTIGIPGDVPGSLPAIAVFCVWLAAHATVPLPLRLIVLVLSASASLIAGAVGFGRSDYSWSWLYGTDRYYYWFVAPFAVVTVASVSALARGRSRPWVLIGLAVLAVVSGIVQVRRTLEPVVRVPWVQSSVTALQSAQRLGAVLTEVASADALTVNDSFVPIEGWHGGGLTLRSMSYEMAPHGIPGLTIVTTPTPASDARLNEALDRWAQREGWPSPPVQARHGTLVRRLVSRLDFQRGGFAHQIGQGFHSWDGRARWMDGRGSVELSRVDGAMLHIVARAPVSVLKVAHPEMRYTVAVRVDDVRLGVMDFGASDVVDTTFPLPAGASEHVRVTLDSAFTWTPKQVDPRNADPRQLSISVELIALEPMSASARR